MAGKVFFSVTMSLDGFIAPEERMDDPGMQRWTAQWMELQQWIFPLRFFRESLKLGEGGEEGRDNEIARADVRAHRREHHGQAHVRPRRAMWPEDAPFHTPVFVVTTRCARRGCGRGARRSISSTTASRARSPSPRGGRRSRRSHRWRRRTIQQYLNAGLINEFSLALSPVMFGSGNRLFEGVDAGRVALEPVRAEATQRVTHLTYAVRER